MARQRIWLRALAWCLLGGLAVAPARGQIRFGEQAYEYEPGDVLPGAVRFERVDTHWKGYGPGEAGPLLGYVFLTDDLVSIPGYSGQSMNTLVGMDLEGRFTGIKLVRHAEPIVLIGIPEKVIHEFVAQYVGKHVTDRILIGAGGTAGYVEIDGISGATVTAVAENATVLEAGRLVARTEGLVNAAQIRKRTPSQEFVPLTWSQLERRGAVGALVVAASELPVGGSGPPVDLRFAVLDPPSIGRNLLGERFYAIVRRRLDESGGSALYIGGLGPVSFKGAGFARGGIFDRFVVEQEGHLFVVKDVDYVNMPVLAAEGAPAFLEGGIFFVGEAFDPAATYTLRLTVPYRVEDERAYATFLAEHRMGSDFVDTDTPFWARRWTAAWPAVAFLLFLIGGSAVAFTFRQRLLPHRKRIHLTVAVLAAVVAGLVFKAQPSTTQILTLVLSVTELKFPTEIFLSEPLIFIFWISIALSLFVWGRGFFCGWLCPYGALLEVLISAWNVVVPERVRHKLEAWEPPQVWRLGKYVTFAVILAVAFVSLPLAEAIDEIEPFKTFVLRLARPPLFVAYFVVLTLVSVLSYRFFCRFLCPLGGALALPSQRPGLPLVRYERCRSCKICARGCEPRAISFDTGRISYAECLQCWDCQSTAQDKDLCPELIVAAKEKRPPRVVVVPVLLAALLVGQTARAATWRAPVGHLQQVVDGAAAGDTVVVEPGVHTGNLVLSKALVLRGREGAVLDAAGYGHVVFVSAPDVTVEGLSLRNCGEDMDTSDAALRVEPSAARVRLTGNRIDGCRFGIWIAGAPDAHIAGNSVQGREDLAQDQRGDCIHLWDAAGATIADNTLDSCRDGIYMELSRDCRVTGNTIRRSRYSVHTMWCDRTRYNDNLAAENLVGLALMFSTRIEARRNVLHNNTTHGMLLVQVTRSEAADNVLIGNSKGLFVYNSLYNTVRDNLVAHNNLGLHYWGGSEENKIHANALVQNQIQVKFVAARDQVWPGNFWSDYGGWDVDGDGRGEVPYRSNTLVDALLWKYPVAKLLLASPALQLLALAEREFPVVSVPKAVDPAPLMEPARADWADVLKTYPARPSLYFGAQEKLPHVPGERR